MTKQETIFKVSGWYSKGYLPDNIPAKYALEAMDVYKDQEVEKLKQRLLVAERLLYRVYEINNHDRGWNEDYQNYLDTIKNNNQ